MSKEILNEEIEQTPTISVIPNIYIYSEKTKEYLGYRPASKDFGESEKQGCFIPIVPQYATLLIVPEFKENEIPVYSKIVTEEKEIIHYIDPVTEEEKEKEVTHKVITENWEVKPDYRKNYYKVDDTLNVYTISEIGDIQNGYLVIKEIGEDIKTNKNWYKIVDGVVIKKSNEEYEQEQKAARENQFNNEFFLTALGYIRRSVTMKNGTQKDFLSDLLPAISASVQAGQAVNIIAYDKPDFTQDVADWTQYQKIVPVTAQFVQECFIQLSNDFLPINNN